MPYITCQEGNIHSRGEQSLHVEQAIYIKNEIDDNGNFPVYIDIIPCNKKQHNDNIDTSENYQPTFILLIFGIIIFQILVIYIAKKLTK